MKMDQNDSLNLDAFAEWDAVYDADATDVANDVVKIDVVRVAVRVAVATNLQDNVDFVRYLFAVGLGVCSLPSVAAFHLSFG